MEGFMQKVKEFTKRAKNLFLESSYFRRQVFLSLFLVILFLVIIFYSLLLSPPVNLENSSNIFTLKSGETLSSVSHSLTNNNFISHPICVEFFATILGRRGSIRAGDYYFPKSQNCFMVTWRITHGDFDLVPIRMTIPEGLNTKEIGDLLRAKFSSFDKNAFITEASSSEGYLFPDTYFFFPNVSHPEVVKVMKDNFSKKVETITLKIASSSKSFKEIITMASIIEDEAITTEDRRIVSGILWKRLKLKMPLQVDATFKYINGKGTFDLTQDDLALDSPYNTYKYAGLPPTPINNPGLDSIRAAIEPTQTKYLYFISDKKGKIYYAEDFEGHQRNRELYLGR